MKFYHLDTEFTFGKYEGTTVRQIIDLHPSYIDWCAINLDHFYISDNVVEEIKLIKPDFALSEEGKQKLDEKYSTWEDDQGDDDEKENYDDNDDYDYQDDYTHPHDSLYYNDALDMDQQSQEFWDSIS